MNKVILISSTQYPGYGGAATNAYAIIKFLREKKYTVFVIFFTNESDNIDPDNIGNIFRFDILTFQKKDMNSINKYRNLIKEKIKAEPDIMLCKNYLAPG